MGGDAERAGSVGAVWLGVGSARTLRTSRGDGTVYTAVHGVGKDGGTAGGTGAAARPAWSRTQIWDNSQRVATASGVPNLSPGPRTACSVDGHAAGSAASSLAALAAGQIVTTTLRVGRRPARDGVGSGRASTTHRIGCGDQTEDVHHLPLRRHRRLANRRLPPTAAATAARHSARPLPTGFCKKWPQHLRRAAAHALRAHAAAADSAAAGHRRHRECQAAGGAAAARGCGRQPTGRTQPEMIRAI